MGLATVFMFKPTKNNLFRHLSIKKNNNKVKISENKSKQKKYL